MLVVVVHNLILITGFAGAAFSVTLRDNEVYFYGAKSVSFDEHEISISRGQPYKGTTCSSDKCDVQAGRHGSYEVAGDFKAGMAALNVVSGGHVGPITTMPTELNFMVEGYFHFETKPTSCKKDTGGTCRVFGCASSRGATDCTSSQCLCKEGQCASEGKCVLPDEVAGDKYKCWLRLAQGHNMMYNTWWLGYKNCVGATRAAGDVITCWCGLSFSGGARSNELVISANTATLLSEQIGNHSIDIPVLQVAAQLGNMSAGDSHPHGNGVAMLAIGVAFVLTMGVIALLRVVGKRTTGMAQPFLHTQA